MFKKVLPLFLCALTTILSVNAQKSDKPSRFKRNFEEEVNKLKNQIGTKVHADNAKEIASSIGYFDHIVYRDNSLIQDQIDIENKIISIANNMITAHKLKVPSKINRVYITKQTNFNCSVTQQGTIYVNLGLLAEIENEAALAAIIGHEITHYYNEDVLKKKIENSKANRENKSKKIFERKWDFETRGQEASYSQGQESIADSLGAIMAHKVGYDLRSGQNNFLTFLYTDKAEGDANLRSGIGLVSSSGGGKEKLNSILKDVLSSHPENLDRYEAFNRYIAKLGSNQGKQYITFSENEFKKINTWAREKLLTQLLIEANYQKCIEKSFLFHLFDEKNMNYVVSFLEATRIVFRVNPKKANVGFLSENFNSKVLSKGQGILSNLRALVLDSTKYAKITAKNLLDSKNVAFSNYDDAFNYFADLALAQKCTECLLSIALRNQDNPELKQEYIKQYIEIPTAKRKQFAKSFQSNSLNEDEKKGKKKLLVLDKFYNYSRGLNSIYVSDINTEGELAALEEEINKFRNPDTCDLITIKESSFNNDKDFIELSEKIEIARALKNGSINYFERNDSKTFWEISPALWELFTMNGYQEIYLQKYMNVTGSSPIVASFIPFALSLSTSSDPMKHKYNMVFSRSTCIGINESKDELFYNDEFGHAIDKIEPVYLLNTVYSVIK